MEVIVRKDIEFDEQKLYNKVMDVLSNLRRRKILLEFEPLDEINVDVIHRKVGLEIEMLIIDIKSENQFFYLNERFFKIENSIFHIYNNLSENNVDKLVVQLNKLGLYMKGE